jgi:hypothetical protein
MERIAFATASTPGNPARAVLLFESLRASGGELARAPCIMLIPEGSGPLSNETEERLSALSVQVVPFGIDEEASRFPLASLVFASAEAEEQGKAESEVLVWMVEDTLVVNSPTVFLLPEGASYAYRPVHHTKIGSVYDRPLDGFWSLIYQHCGVTEDRVFPMETCTRDNILRPYFNAGILVIRLERRLLSTWRDYFRQLYRHPDFEPFYQQDVLYRIFMHQAVLTGVVLNRLERHELRELPETINYPLHLHDEYPPEHRPDVLNELVTCRYEDIRDLRNALKDIPVREPLKSWLNNRLG